MGIGLRATGARDFLDEQIEDYERRLEAAEARLALFKQQNVDVLPGAGGDYYSRMQQARNALNEAQLQLDELMNRRAQFQRQLAGEEPMMLMGAISGVTGVTPARLQSMSPLDSRIQVAAQQYGYAADAIHQQAPGSAAVEENDRRAGAGEGPAARPGSGDRQRKIPRLRAIPVFPTILFTRQCERISPRPRRALRNWKCGSKNIANRVDQLEGKVNSIPEVEAELKQLDRDYNVVASQHNQMLQRRESARLTEDIEQSASDVTFRVIEPPFVPRNPSEPNKTLLNGLVLLGALAIGAGIALLLSLLRPVVSNATTLMSISGLPTLGVIPLTRGVDERRRELKHMVGFSGLAMGLPLLFVALTVTQRLVAA